MESENIKRGIDFKNRFGQSRIGDRFKHTFSWWKKDSRINRLSFLFMSIVFAINLILIYPIFLRDVSISYSSSVIQSIALLLGGIGIQTHQFFSFLTIFSFLFIPISCYLFVRKLSLKHELIAFVAVLFFIIPTAFFPDNGLPLIASMLNGDGAHVVAFAFIPFFLLYFQAFISKGVPAWGLIATIEATLIAIISPFAFFNFLIFASVITVAEGFMGEFRIKIARFFFVLVFSILLSFFWYYPGLVGKIMVLSHIKNSIAQLWSIFPILITVVPILGAVFFLLFDRREKLKPIFIALSLFIIYFFLFSASKALSINGIFTADRYLIELNFAIAFLSSVVIVVFGEIILNNFILKIKSRAYLFFIIFICSSIVTYVILQTVINISMIHMEAINKVIVSEYQTGIGNINRSYEFNFESIFGSLISIVSLFILITITKKLPSLSLIIKKKVD